MRPMQSGDPTTPNEQVDKGLCPADQDAEDDGADDSDEVGDGCDVAGQAGQLRFGRRAVCSAEVDTEGHVHSRIGGCEVQSLQVPA